MNDERWYGLVERIEEKLPVEEKTEEEGRHRATIETIIFTGPQGRMRLERVSRPLVLDRKVRVSKRIGDVAEEEYIYSDTEKSHRVRLFEWTDEEWEEVDFRQLASGGAW
jgi:hypothetical protein